MSAASIANWVSQGYALRTKKAPVNIADGVGGIELGTVLELESLRGFLLRWHQHKPKLLWNEKAHALIFVDIPDASLGPKQKIASPPIKPKQARQFEAFHGTAPTKSTTYRIFSRGRQWITFGSVVRIDYSSGKWGKRDQYTHDHGRGVMLYRLGEDSGPTLWVIKGGKLNVNKRGIVQ